MGVVMYLVHQNSIAMKKHIPDEKEKPNFVHTNIKPQNSHVGKSISKEQMRPPPKMEIHEWRLPPKS